MAIRKNISIYVVCETEEETENNMNPDCYVSDYFEDIRHAERGGWLIVSDTETYCPNCKKKVKHE